MITTNSSISYINHLPIRGGDGGPKRAVEPRRARPRRPFQPSLRAELPRHTRHTPQRARLGVEPGDVGKFPLGAGDGDGGARRTVVAFGADTPAHHVLPLERQQWRLRGRRTELAEVTRGAVGGGRL